MKRSLVLVLALAAAGCGGGSKHASSCDPTKVDACGGGQVCEQIQGGTTGCFAPVEVKGVVFDLAGTTASDPIQGARVVPLDVNGAPLGSAATTGPSGAYTVRVPATRDAGGKPVSGVTLRADAAGYATFPSGIRSAVPIVLDTATLANGVWTVTSASTPLTDVGLVADPSAGTARIHGAVAGVSRAGALVVATPAGVADAAGRTGIADADGSYVLFNLPAGDWTVQAYAKGLSHAAKAVAGLGSGEDRLVDLATRTGATAAVSGSVQRTGQRLPNPAVATSVILVVRSTFDAGIDRGESPPGLVVTVPADQGTYTVTGVPDGEYVALAAFENDGYVRDVSGIGGTDPVIVTVADGVVTTPQGNFKITGAVGLTGITPSSGAEGSATVVTSAAPTFAWGSYPSADTYEVTVFNWLGDAIWGPVTLPSSTTSVDFAGPALQDAMTYQVRIAAFDTGGSQISRTEDLKGLFVYRP